MLPEEALKKVQERIAASGLTVPPGYRLHVGGVLLSTVVSSCFVPPAYVLVRRGKRTEADDSSIVSFVSTTDSRSGAPLAASGLLATAE